ncbi:hypothetical protein A5714_08885 [Mycobacterium sp. E2462]|uniref:GAP family protein n=1 Tax=Mycobacterium sp. E2462 TaxID=1834133 RepID=UPI000801CA6A|nr:GAP family protein [Mycobacterium sp. E2462]OBI19831.1 hypothetical protein A5714_08885 [Mycobacterium sp. E2462]
MLVTIVVMALAVSLEPFRIGMTVLMLNRPRPALQLLAFLSGGFAMGTTVGLAVLFVFRRVLPAATYFTLPRVQVMIGALALLAAAVLAGRASVLRRSRRDRTAPAGDERDGSGGAPGRLASWRTRIRNERSLWVAAAAGLGIALPSVDYLAALAAILASRAAVVSQVGALVVFNVVAFAFVEIPLIAYAITPEATRATMTALQRWIRSRRDTEVAGLLAAVGAVLLAVGAISL